MIKVCVVCGGEFDSGRGGGRAQVVTCSGKCRRAIINERQRQSRLNDPDKWARYMASYRARHREKIRENQKRRYASSAGKKYRERNADRIRDTSRKYREKNRESIREKNRKYAAARKEQQAKNARRRRTELRAAERALRTLEAQIETMLP